MALFRKKELVWTMPEGKAAKSVRVLGENENEKPGNFFEGGRPPNGVATDFCACGRRLRPARDVITAEDLVEVMPAVFGSLAEAEILLLWWGPVIDDAARVAAWEKVEEVLRIPTGSA